jgi:alpha-1,3/alpha-1,6-mannosyltransferase
VVDQVSPVVPILKLCGRRVIFYCHFPDKALSGPRLGLLKRAYRFWIDLWEELSLLFADQILVNSTYTKAEFYRLFPILRWLKVKTTVLYPSIDLSEFKPNPSPQPAPYFLSLNRY